VKALLLRETAPLSSHATPLNLDEIPEPEIGEGEALIRVTACGVCHTELDEIEGRLAPTRLPIVPGHQVVGVVEAVAGGSQRAQRHAPEDAGAAELQIGQRVGVAWIYSACGICEYCRSDRENLCVQFVATGRDVNGGYAQFMKARADFVHHLPASFADIEAAPMLCAGAIGYRSLRLANIQDGDTLGLFGFGSSAHLVIKTARHLFPHSEIFVFTRNPQEREFARALGASWTGGINDTPPAQMNAVIETTPAWTPVLQALKNLKPGGRLVINAIRKEAADAEVLSKLDYASQLWMEKEIKSVANVTRRDVSEFLALAAGADIRPEVQAYDMEQANEALVDMRRGKIRGAKVLRI